MNFNFNSLHHKSLEKLTLVILLIGLFVIAIYFFVFKIDWIGVYSNQNIDNYKNLSVLTETCVQCHGEVKGFSPFHNPQKIGCASCHLGNKIAKNKNEAHTGMVLIPGN